MPHILPGPARTPSRSVLRPHSPYSPHLQGSRAQAAPSTPCIDIPDRQSPGQPQPRGAWAVMGRGRTSLIAALFGVALVAAGCHGDGDAAKKAAGPGGPGGAMPPMPVTVVKVERHPVPLRVKAPGQAEGSREVEVRARVGGVLMRKLYEEGDVVKAGQPMYEIDRVPLEIALSQAKAQLGQAQAQFDNARREESRLKPLAERRAVSQREYDNAVSARRTAEASRAAAESQIRDAELNLSYSTVKAPIAGVSGRSQQSEGNLITLSSNSLLTTISTIDPVWVRFGLSEADVRRLQSGKIESVRVVDSAGNILLEHGEINFASTTIDRTLGTQQLRVTFPNPDRKVLPGQFVQVEVAIAGREAWTVPQQAVIQSDQGRMVWVVGGDGKIAPRPVKVAEWAGKDWVVTDGLNDGDQVVIDNLFKIRPGASVAPHPPGQPGGTAGGDGSTKAN